MAAQENTKRKTTYVVQRLTSSTEPATWEDIGTVVVAARGRRPQAIKAAVENAYGTEFEEANVRVLDEKSAHIYPVKAKQQTSLEIG
jgi:hypothetical protein